MNGVLVLFALYKYGILRYSGQAMILFLIGHKETHYRPYQWPNRSLTTTSNNGQMSTLTSIVVGTHYLTRTYLIATTTW